MSTIGIYPEWNVKKRLFRAVQSALKIGIYPEWNVKVKVVPNAILATKIGIYPEWNVKIIFRISCSTSTALEYIQNGM